VSGNITEHIPPDSPNGKQVLIPASRDDWRAWLDANWDRQEGLWVVYRKKSADIVGPVYDDLVEEALCFGWIDSVTRRADDMRMIQWFSPRRPGGIWSALNKDRIERLREQGLMTAAGQAAIDRSIADGSWSQTDQVDALIIPHDLQAALDTAPGAREAFDSLSVSDKKQHLWSVYSAKRPETRSKRITDVVRILTDG
jgi:uncharacterized protein YdeI (YjbR/CyaY-like superfamily)